MELTPEQQAVLDILKEHDIEKGEYLSVLTVERERSNLPKEAQDNWNDIVKSLVKAGYITRDPLGYGLTEKGHYQLYHQPSG